MASTTSSRSLPCGSAIFTSMPDLLFIPEFVFGGLVWTLVASTRVFIENPQGWVMFVSIFCFVTTTLWFFFFLCGTNQKGAFWPTLDVAYHAIATVFYLSAAVALAYVTVSLGNLSNPLLLKYYREDIAASGYVMFVSVLCFLWTFLWMIIFACGGHKNGGGWAAADFVYHFLAVLLYLSASVSLAKTTIDLQNVEESFKSYQIDIAAVVSTKKRLHIEIVHCPLLPVPVPSVFG
ncbi:hypothetical protein JZ751_018511 [Albula glossodonta]|uniref:Myelin and lymphocyte protein n=1 Tax=Albula glossodonta TaxID=121402 RepID=A0A8T2NNG0_9TELE|nr:hypothetical protein JZ751_018511 [Albula glossodonta]